MIAGRRNSFALAAWATVLIAGWQPNAKAQQPATPAPTQAQPPAPGDPAAQIDQLLKKANEQMNVKGRFKDAEETAKQAVDLSQKLGDKLRTMQAMLYLGSAYYYQGRMPEALEVFQGTVALAREIGNRKGLSRALNNSAGVLRDLGLYEESLGHFYQCLTVARELDDLPMQWTAIRNIGHLYMQLGDPDKAEAPLQESLRIAHRLKHSDIVRDPAKVATESSLLSLGQLETAREHYQLALKYFEQCRSTNPEHPLFLVEMLNSMAGIHEKLGEPQKSMELLQEAMKIAEKAASGLYPMMVSDLGHSQESLGLLNEALASQDRALALVRRSGGNPEFEWQIESRIAHVDRALGRSAEALEHYRNSIKGLERLRASALNTESGRASILARSRATYAETADLLADLHREAEALEVAERGRARAFLDTLVVSRSGLPNELTLEQAKREEALLARISTIQKELWKENLSAKEERQRKAELTSAEDDLEAFHLEVRHANPHYASIRYPEPITVSRIRKELLDAQTVLVEFILGEKRSLVWAVSKDRVSVGVLRPRKEIEEEVAAFRKALTEKTSSLTLHESLAEISRRGQRLYASLLQPLENTIAAGRRLIIVPDGVLGYLPFETLVAGSSRGAPGNVRNRYLLEKFAIVYGPSASALVAIKGMLGEPSGRPKMLLAFGDPIVDDSTRPANTEGEGNATRAASPDPTATAPEEYAERGFSLTQLPYTRAEVLNISRLYPASQRQVYLGKEAREETLKTEKLDGFRYIHFASHGFIDETRPARSGILFSRDSHSTEDGVLQMGEVMRLKLTADLVTLSACSTGRGKLVNGEGILGLTRAFFYAGAHNAAVSLWNVNDSATATLMKAFYRNLNRGRPKGEALRQAKLNLLRGDNALLRHPYFWAAFVLIGEGK